MKSEQKKILFIFNALSYCLKLHKIIWLDVFSIFSYVRGVLFYMIAYNVVFSVVRNYLFYER
ncbi:hypothetical protein LFZ45_08365 [Salmonella enterica subsp. enterica serovar Weslaco str. 247K]|uniref:Uncharacterized protein n=1 Tax=Salmonella enterica subsp. enterica serovar Weslaco TaxID=1243597 RepID=A0A5X3P275_SALET|nr:hypothetical protein [Salmonella enterica]EBZ5929742.1 hypothetical protein [Salmonella enterica subsp. enterica serovar Weslaco]KSB71983.1 hypothetical protein LFZ45_08365 [Salmonella enterica subsp. enterica serovar Weslaco str. 247K]EBZ6051935.1 hypothetical protein [Salmonella enterica subsp. enterica serovar Weslaco]EBZ6062282.1 hypothetical protein [Salmonella enterica subsp. enterica serovar Weslaco]